VKHASWILVLAAVGCEPSLGHFEWQPPRSTNVAALAQKYPHAVAVLLGRDDQIALTFDQSPQRTQIMRHDTIAILSDGGDRYAEVTVPVGDGRVQFLQARTIGPDGRVEEVTPTEVHTETARTGNRLDGVEVEEKVFRLPGVRVGSVIEYAYGLENDHPTYFLTSTISEPIPVEHYHLEVSVDGPAAVAVRTYNTHSKLQREGHDGEQRLVLDEHDIPAAKKEPLAPAATVTEPWWALTLLTAPVGRHFIVGVFDSWSHTFTAIAHVLNDRKAEDYAGAALKPSLDGCDGRARCAVERALALVTSKTELSGFVSSIIDARPLKEVLASGLANNVEKALMLRGALAAAGVKASLAALARDLNQDFDPGFPSARVGDHLIVAVDKQPGIEDLLFIDPSCESCALGELPGWSAERQAILFGKPQRPLATGQEETPVSLVRLASADPGLSAHRQTIDATLEANGRIRGQIADEWNGRDAVDLRVQTRKWLDDAWRKEVESDLHARANTAQLDAVSPLSWDKRAARAALKVEYSAPGYAASDGARLVVPLSFLELPTDRELDDQPRRHDVMVRAPKREEETMVFHLPSGWVATDLPHGSTWHSEAADALFEVRSAPGTVTVRRVVQTHLGHWGPGEWSDVASVLRKLSATRRAAFTVGPAR